MKAPRPRRVVLARPSWDRLTTRAENTYNRTWPPLSSLYVASALSQLGQDVAIADAQAGPAEARRTIAGLGCDDLVFLSTADVDRWQCPHLEMEPIDRMAAAIRTSGARFYLTGTHGAVAPEMMLERTGAHGVLKGEPETAAVAIASGVPPAEVAGLVVRADGSLLDTGPAPTIDLTKLPSPDYSLLDLDRYRYELLGPRFALFEGSRGCPFPCTFCSRVLQGLPMRRKRPEQLIAEVDRAVRRDGVRSAYFIDLEFNLGGATSRALCEYLARERPPLRWCCQLRAREAKDDLVDALAAGGCRLVHCGIESGSPERLKDLDKVGTVDDMVAGVRRLLARGMEVLCFFIFGFPGETEAQIAETLRVALELDPSYASFHLFTPYPGTQYAVAPTGGPLFVPATHPEALPFERLARLRRHAYLRFYLRPGYLASRLARGEVRSLLRQVRLFLSQIAA